MCHYQIGLLCKKKIKNLCVRSIEEFTNLCVHTSTCKVDIASWGTPSPSSAIYNFGHLVRGRAIATKIRNCVLTAYVAPSTCKRSVAKKPLAQKNSWKIGNVWIDAT